jgi:hypothetical protein
LNENAMMRRQVIHQNCSRPDIGLWINVPNNMLNKVKFTESSAVVPAFCSIQHHRSPVAATARLIVHLTPLHNVPSLYTLRYR